MHQTFYIDIDEEITSVIERLRKADADEAVIVVPKQAALIQSIVNLKLLKKESERLGVGLILVTQDKLGRVMIEKAGIAVEQKLEDIEGEELLAEEKPKKGRKKAADQPAKEDIRSEKRAGKIGSDSFFDPSARPKDNEYFIAGEGLPESSLPGTSDMPDGSEKIVNRELVTGIALDIKKGKSTRMDLVAKKAFRSPEKEEGDVSFDEGLAKPEKPLARRTSGHQGTSIADDRLENFFSPNLSSRHRRNPEAEAKLPVRRPIAEDAEPDDDISANDDLVDHPAHKAMARNSGKGRRIMRYALSAALFAAGCGALYAAYLFVPEATIAITTKKESKSGDVEITADAKAGSPDYGSRTIPAKLLDVSVQASDSFSPSGSKSSAASSSKARGKVTLYNEFSSAPQALVATTRLESSDGKIFRLNAGVTIPGMEKDGTPGSVEAFVTADQSGADYDIDPTTFTIPGFKSSGSGKYSKFYAKSADKMTGGDGSGSGGSFVTESDISNAKSKIGSKLKDAIIEKAKESFGDDAVLLDDAFEMEEPNYSVSVAAGEVADSFAVSAEARAQAVVFKESDIDAMANSLISGAGSLKTNLSSVSVELDYGKSSLDLKSETLGIKAHATSSVSSGIDAGKLKEGMLGKTNEELEEYLRNYSSIEKAEVSYWPPVILDRIPKYPQRVKVEINPESGT